VHQDDQGIQMSRHEEDHSIQVGVLVNNASIQYSAKPVFENISQDYIDEEDDE
jgi:short-subunit dehydrogenase